MSGSNFQLQFAERLYREGRLEEALAAFDGCLAADPRLALARSFRGLIFCHGGDFDGGIAQLQEATTLAPRDATLHANLGTMLFVQDRLDEAQEALRRALALTPGHPEANANMSLVLRARGDFEGAERAARTALAARADFVEARVNLGYALLAQGKFAEGFAATSSAPHMPNTVAHHDALPTQPGAIIVHGEQGLGDTLFFLRFAPRLRELGHRLAFWGDARLHPLLRRTGLFEHFMGAEAMPGPGLTLLWAGDLPRLLGGDFASLPSPLPLAADPAKRDAMRARLAAAGPAPYVGLTWRAGLPRTGRVVLSKNVPPDALGMSLRGFNATWISLQRTPQSEELAALAQGLGAPVQDAGAANADLDDAIALLELLDDYVGVSNTNTHLRAGAGKGARVLVPYPPEWRWLAGVDRSPWFAAMPTYRQGSDGDWSAALARLRAQLGKP